MRWFIGKSTYYQALDVSLIPGTHMVGGEN